MVDSRHQITIHRIHTRAGWEWTLVPPRPRWFRRVCTWLACMGIGAGLAVAVVAVWGG